MIKTFQTILLLVVIGYLSLFIYNLGMFAKHNEPAVFISLLQSFDIKLTSYTLFIFDLTKNSFIWIFLLFLLMFGIWAIIKRHRKSTILALVSLYSIAILCYIAFPFILYA